MAGWSSTLRAAGITAVALSVFWLGPWSRSVSVAGEADDTCTKCAPVSTRATTEAREVFIARDQVEALKSAHEFAYRVATERVVRTVEGASLRCPKAGCTAGGEEITTGIEDSFPCRRGSLRMSKKRGKPAKKSLAQWRKACLATIDYASKCDDAELQRDKPAWAECRISVWAEKSRNCAPPHCRANTSR